MVVEVDRREGRKKGRGVGVVVEGEMVKGIRKGTVLSRPALGERKSGKTMIAIVTGG